MDIFAVDYSDFREWEEGLLVNTGVEISDDSTSCKNDRELFASSRSKVLGVKLARYQMDKSLTKYMRGGILLFYCIIKRIMNRLWCQ